MLWRVLQANDGKLPDETIVCFANTGKEMEETLEFVRECGERWAVPITWLEYQTDAPGYAVVDFHSASRNGEPFEAIIRKRNYLPNPVTRFCTVELKIRVMFKMLRDTGKLSDGLNMMIGIRADEPRRVAKMRNGKNSESVKIINSVPLADAGIGVHEINEFWEAQPFNLRLPTHNGRTLHGNCDLCFLKPAGQVASLIREVPARGEWWARMEKLANDTFASNKQHGPGTGWYFRMDRPNYRQMLDFAAAQGDMFDPDEPGIECFCGE